MTTRWLKSVTYTAPAESTATACGWDTPGKGGTVGVSEPGASFTTRPYMPWLVTYTAPAESTATPPGERRKLSPLNGSTFCPQDSAAGPPFGGPTTPNTATSHTPP